MDDRSTTTVLLALNTHELRCAAWLGGLPLTFDGPLTDDELLCDEWVRFFVHRGLHRALHESFNRAFPMRYPDDCGSALFDDWASEGVS